MKKTTIAITILSISLFAALAMLAFVWIAGASSNKALKTQLENVYQNNFYELNDNVGNIESNLSKLVNSKERSYQQEVLGQVVAECNNAQANLSALPLKQNVIGDTTNFVNQLGGFSYVLREKLVLGKDLSLDDIDQLETLGELCSQIKYELNRLAFKIAQGYSIVDNSGANVESSQFNTDWGNFGSDILKYPQLIYDGPFSDSVQHREVKGLIDSTVTEAEAESSVKNWFKNASISYASESVGGDFDTWNYDIKIDGFDGYVQVTKKGGKLLQFAINDNPTQDEKTINECEFLAEVFAKSVGYDDTKSVWSTQSGNYVLCNLCYVKDDVVVYPDMIKVKVNKQNGMVVGFEARSFAFNHVERSDFTPAFSVEEAKQKVGSDLNIMTSMLCVVPDDYVGEKLAYEFKCVSNDAVYYVYVDAKTLEQFRILKIIQTTDGNLLI